MKRQNTHLEAEGAEFLVLGELLIRGIPAYKAYSNMAGYDLVATNPDKNSAARISVKSRWRTGAQGFIIKNFDCDFVVVTKLNRGSKDGRGTVLLPEHFIFPVDFVKELPRNLSGWGKIEFKKIPKMTEFRDKWDRIREFLARGKAR